MPALIGPTAHCANDYGFVIAALLAPSVLKLQGTAKTLCYLFGGTVAAVDMLTDNPLGAAGVLSFRQHGHLETPFVPALLAVPLLTGAMKEKKARGFFTAYFLAAVAHYMLTDYDADEPGRRRLT